MAKELKAQEQVDLLKKYIGYEVEVWDTISNGTVRLLDGDLLQYLTKEVIPYKIVVKPLNRITGEDAVDVAKLSGYAGKKNMVQIGKDVIQGLLGDLGEYRPKNEWAIYQFLKSKQYDLPLWISFDHWANGKTLLDLSLAVTK